MHTTFTVKTEQQDQWVELTSQIQEEIRLSGIQDGICLVFVMHTTAGITINENADPDVRKDCISILKENIPWEGNYCHGEGNSAAHIKASLMGSGQTIPIRRGELALGSWQGIFLTEFDGPRTRTVYIHIQPDYSATSG